MQSSNPFKQVEDKYFILRGQLELGRITRDQFETALHDLMLQDTQGRHWILGVDSGKWFVHDGKAWGEADPYSVGVVGKSVAVPPSVAPARQIERRVPVAAPVPPPPATIVTKPKKGLGCVRLGCGSILVLFLLIGAIVAVLYFRVPQQLGLLPSAERIFNDTPDRQAATALRDDLTKAGIDTKGMGIYVMPFRDKPGSVAYVTLDGTQGFKFKSGSKDPVVDYFKQMVQSDAAKKYGIQRVAIEYKSPKGTPLLSLTASTDTITAFASGAINRSEFLKKLDGQVNWVGFYQEVLQ